MNLCTNGHDKDVVGIYQGRRCLRCKREQDRKYSQTPKGKARDYRFKSKPEQRIKARRAAKLWAERNRERYLDRMRRWGQKVKRAGGRSAYFWQSQAKESL